jgi:lipopolysaccharide export system permease protein
LTGFIFVFLLVELTDKIKYYFQYNPPGMLMLKYFLVKIPGYLFFAVPMSILLGGMLSLSMLAKNSELIAMQAGGIDPLNIGKPVIIVSAMASVLMFIANESVIPWSNRYSEYIQNVQIAGKTEKTFFQSDQIWLRSIDSITRIQKFDRPNKTLEKVSVVRWDSNYEFVDRLFADKAKWWQNHWVFYGVNRILKDREGRYVVESSPSMIGTLKKSPEEFDQTEMPAKEMNLGQLGSHIDRLIAEGQNPTRFLVDWHDKIAFPMVCLIMGVLSVPFPVGAGPRRGGLALGLGLSLVIAFSYWIAHSMFLALGHGGYLTPIIAAWGANLVFGPIAAMLLLKACN